MLRAVRSVSIRPSTASGKDRTVLLRGSLRAAGGRAGSHVEHPLTSGHSMRAHRDSRPTAAPDAVFSSTADPDGDGMQADIIGRSPPISLSGRGPFGGRGDGFRMPAIAGGAPGRRPASGSFPPIGPFLRLGTRLDNGRSLGCWPVFIGCKGSSVYAAARNSRSPIRRKS